MISIKAWEEALKLTEDDIKRGRENLEKLSIAILLQEEQLKQIKLKLKQAKLLDDERKSFKDESKTGQMAGKSSKN